MARKRYGEDDILRLIREVEVHCNSGMDVVSACRATHASNALGKWLKKDFGLTAHSLRHTFRDRLRASGCPLELIDQIGGWSSIGTIGSKYGQGYELESVREQLEAITLKYCKILSALILWVTTKPSTHWSWYKPWITSMFLLA